MRKRTIFSVWMMAAVMLSTTAYVWAGRKKGDPIPGTPWRVHDMRRPRPKVVKPGVDCATPPSDAIVLFDGKTLVGWEQKEFRRNSKGKRRATGKWIATSWPIKDGYMSVRGGDIRTKQRFGDCQLHIEWSVPVEGKKKRGQGFGNSGVFLMEKYEVQVLDTYNDENKTYADGQAGAIYGQGVPLANPARKAGQWNVYDIVFRRPRFDKSGKVVHAGYITVLFNGVAVQNNFDLKGPVRHRKWAKYSPHADKLPLSLQDHGYPVRYRNIWIRPLE